MRGDGRGVSALLGALAFVLALAPPGAGAQHARAGAPVLRARRFVPGSPVKMFIPSGTVQLIGWDRDSLVVRGTVPSPATLVLSGDSAGLKLVIEQRERAEPAKCDLVIYVPRASLISLKSVDAAVASIDVGGWFYTVSGSIRLEGSMSSIDAEAMSGDIDLAATTPWARAKTGKGELIIRGAPQDLDASTISGAMHITTSSIVHGRFTSVTGDIVYAASMTARSLFEISNHSGAVDLLLPRDVSAKLELSSVDGMIDNGFVQVHPAAAGVHNLQLTLGAGGADVTVRTFRGPVRLRSR